MTNGKYSNDFFMESLIRRERERERENESDSKMKCPFHAPSHNFLYVQSKLTTQLQHNDYTPITIITATAVASIVLYTHLYGEWKM